MKRATYDRYKRIIDFMLRLDFPVISGFLRRSVYDESFFTQTLDLKKRSSRKVAEIICSLYDFTSVLDIGCGMGLYISELGRMEKQAFGCDSSRDAIALAPNDCFVFFADVTKDIHINQRFDLVICFEVAEHIRKRHSETLVKNCTRYGDCVLFTAAPKGQGGVGHINEQSYDFWIRLFEKRHFEYERDRSLHLREVMEKAGVVEWIASNIMCFQKAMTSNQAD